MSVQSSITDHQALTLNPGVPHPGLFPSVMSLNVALILSLYNKGLTNPRVGKPLVSRASFNNAKIPAAVGDDAEVPLTEIVAF